jgi:hypothetical protein
MHSSNLWHKFYLHWAKGLIFLVFTTLISIESFGQITIYKRKNLQNYDVERLHYGFYMGTGFSRFKLKYSDKFLNSTSQAVNIYSKTEPSFKLGLTANYYLTRRLDVKILPGITIGNRNINVDTPQSSVPVTTYGRTFSFAELPLMLKFKSDRRMNTRMYAMAGLNIVNEANIRKSSIRQIAALPTKTTDFCIEYGVGMEQFLPFGKITPELRFSHGLRNLYKTDTSKLYDPLLKTSRSHTVSFYLFFD